MIVPTATAKKLSLEPVNKRAPNGMRKATTRAYSPIRTITKICIGLLRAYRLLK